MSRPKRNFRPDHIHSLRRTFHVVSSTFGKMALLQSERMVTLLIDTLFHYCNEGDYKLHAFVVMRNHFHVLLTIDGDGAIERAMQKIKGGFSYRANKELRFQGEIWQRGFTDQRIWDADQFYAVRKYIDDNPVRKKMVLRAEEYPFSSAHERYRKLRG